MKKVFYMTLGLAGSLLGFIYAIIAAVTWMVGNSFYDLRLGFPWGTFLVVACGIGASVLVNKYEKQAVVTLALCAALGVLMGGWFVVPALIMLSPGIYWVISQLRSHTGN